MKEHVDLDPLRSQGSTYLEIWSALNLVYWCSSGFLVLFSSFPACSLPSVSWSQWVSMLVESWKWELKMYVLWFTGICEIFIISSSLSLFSKPSSGMLLKYMCMAVCQGLHQTWKMIINKIILITLHCTFPYMQFMGSCNAFMCQCLCFYCMQFMFMLFFPNLTSQASQ